MNLKEYQKRALTTAQFPREQAAAYLTLGLCGEIAELMEMEEDDIDPTPEKILAENGDVLWYVASLADEYGIELDESYVSALDSTLGESAGMMMHAGLIANKVKKLIRDGTPIDREFLDLHLTQIIAQVQDCVQRYDATLEWVAEENIKKLESRKLRGVIAGSGDKR